MSKRNRKRKECNPFYGDNYWESKDYNQRAFIKNLDMLLSLAINRFRWLNLPETCDARFLEKMLHRNGIASFSYDKSQPTRIFTTLQAMPEGRYNMYGLPTRWRSVGVEGETDYECDNENGVLCYYSYARVSPWNALEIYARKLAHFERVDDVNLTQQMTPFIGIAPQEKQLELTNMLKQVQGGEPAILGDESMGNMIDKFKTLDIRPDLLTEQLARGWQNTLNNALLYLGIPHLAFEKGERMIEDEARANTAPTNIMLLDCLNARREMCEKVNRKWGLKVECVFNTDIESYNYNYLNNIEAMAQDDALDLAGLPGGGGR